MRRKLDGVFFRILDDGKWDNICFSDLTPEQRVEVMEGRSVEWLKSLCQHLADVIADIGEEFDLSAE